MPSDRLHSDLDL